MEKKSIQAFLKEEVQERIAKGLINETNTRVSKTTRRLYMPFPDLSTFEHILGCLVSYYRVRLRI